MSLLDNLIGGATPGGNLAKPIGIAMLALLAYRASHGGSAQPAQRAAQPAGGTSAGGLLGGLLGGAAGGGLLDRLLGGNPLAGSTVPPTDSTLAQAKTAVPQGLQSLVQRFEQGGFGDVAKTWVGTGQNRPIGPDQLHQALGADTVDELSRQTGIPHQDLLSQLAQALPMLVDRLTPDGRIPAPHEMQAGT
jgi:uncharacterized protein YidB (DUF937 family)